LYGPECRANKAAFQTTAVLTGVTGAVITSPGFASFSDGYFAGGIFEWERSEDIWELRTIKDHVGESISLAQSIIGMSAGVTVNAFPGCAHDKTDCDLKFDNIENYGGFTDIPRKNPFGTGGAF
jgi:uncharacterized phage protein (TIGR02218 family)